MMSRFLKVTGRLFCSSDMLSSLMPDRAFRALIMFSMSVS